ncbi:hypothetical protein P781_12120 [Vibrio mimicus CAIM 1883]|nr:hypothetical protein P781_12120 [Vibrio mimicus CAIM 1883]ERM55007.1 hypothetical protein P780_12095 [Vibrio mimicus CAIM 1882]
MDFFWTGQNYTRSPPLPQREIYHTQFFIFCFKSNQIEAKHAGNTLSESILSQTALFFGTR